MMKMDQRKSEKIIAKPPQKIRKGARGAPKEKTGCRTCKYVYISFSSNFLLVCFATWKLERFS